LPPANTEEETKKKQETTKMLMKIWSEVDGRNAITMVDNFLPSLMMPEEDPYKFFNQNPHLLPLNNCVWDFKQSKAVPYEREHYFTFKIPINYDPDADTSLMDKAMNDWFKGNEEVIDFLQFYIGYILTGETTRQDMLGVWGSSAGNGKSLLWGEIVPILLGGTDGYFAKISSEAFTSFKSGDTNDQIYGLNGKRFAFLSEPRKRFDTNMIKELTGDKEYTVSAKYKGSITFILSVKIAMAFNEIPDIDLNENGMNRRFNCVEQNKEFKPPEAYDALPEERKPFYGKQDERFVAELLENKEGLMLWALRGATKYMENKKRTIPESMKATKQKACGEIDILGNWCRRFLKVEPNSKVKVADLKRRWAEERLQFNQNEKSFVRTFLGRIESIVPGIGKDEGRAGKGEAKLLNCRVLTAEEADAEEDEADQE
jgi:putative DNA primase/helicase